MRTKLYAGLMSGTSLDAIDAAVVAFEPEGIKVVATLEHAFPTQLREQLAEFVIGARSVSLDLLGQSSRELAYAYAAAIDATLKMAGLTKDDLVAIGCHGQTLRHQPYGDPAFTLQIGDAATLAVLTGIPVVSDFRSADIALGGQGAPLAPAFHEYAFSAATARAVVNIGGIANITLLQPGVATSGYDTGPGNTLLDGWCSQHLGQSYDRDGAWAASGTINMPLLDSLLADPYFAQVAPKSTGREYFNSAWLQWHLDQVPQVLQHADVQATLTELTARTIAAALKDAGDDLEVLLCGGGAHNTALVARITTLLSKHRVASTAAAGIAPDWVEAVAFAWLAKARIDREPGNLPAVTGASRQTVLGALHLP